MKRTYYLLLGYLIPTLKGNATMHGWKTGTTTFEELIADYKKRKYALPRNKTYLKFNDREKIEIVFYDFNKGYFLLNVRSRGRAYYIANIIRSYFTIFYGWSSAIETGYYLPELNKRPNYRWTKEQLIQELIVKGNFNHEFEFEEDGYILDKRAMDTFKEFAIRVYSNELICESLSHLLESYTTFNTFMTGSYYQFHYSRERKYLEQMHLEKKYYERRFRYEISFVAAFKALENFFGVNDIKRNEIRDLLDSKANKHIGADKTYDRQFELYGGEIKKVTQAEIIEHFLILRNVVGAHGNRKPPKHLIITEDDIAEIQNFVRDMVYYKVYEDENE